jgi:Ca2+-binding EF-hand superfamily protein
MVFGAIKDGVGALTDGTMNAVTGGARMGLNVFKILSVTGARQDEQELRAADRLTEDRSEACAVLRARMRKNQVYCRQTLADAEQTAKMLHANEDKVMAALQESEKGAEEFQKFRNDIEGDVEIQTRRPHWRQAISDFMTAAEGTSAETNSDNADTDTLARLMCEYLVSGEPKTQAAAVVLYHPSAPISECLKVTHAVGDVGLHTGQVLRQKSKKSSDIAKLVLDVVNSGNPLLSNPHGNAEGDVVSIVPLFSSTRGRFGAIVSGPTAVPDEFVETFARTAGQMFERIGKLEVVWRVITCIEQFILKQCAADHRLVFIKFVKDAVINPSLSEWAWQPLMYTNGDNEKRFELALRFRDGEPIGVFSVECGTFTPMDEQLIILLHTVAPLLLNAIKEVEEMELGDPHPIGGVHHVMARYEERLPEIAKVLSDELSVQVKTSPCFHDVIVETYTLVQKVEDADMLHLLKAVLALAGHTKLKGWAEVRSTLKSTRKIVEALSSADLTKTAASKKKKKKDGKSTAAVHEDRWNCAEASLKLVDLNQLALRSSVPVQILIRWLKMARMVQHVSLAMAMGELGPDPNAKKLFNAIDADKSGSLSTDEVIAFLMDEVGSEKALRLFRVLDTDGDGRITEAEWHKAWQDGEFELAPESSSPDGAQNGTARKMKLMSKHVSSGDLLKKPGLAGAKGKSKKKLPKISDKAVTPAP